MFDFAWSEILLIGAVALIAIGPKDMPAAIRAVSRMIKKARRMAAEFQTHVDEMVREADLGDVKGAFNDLRRMDLPSVIEKHIDPDRSIRKTFADNPLEPVYPTAGPTAGDVSTLDEVAASQPAVLTEPVIVVEPAVVEIAVCTAPAFIPPSLVPKPVVAAAAVEQPPAFIPPQAVLQRQSR